jgi:predicted DNA-binding protein
MGNSASSNSNKSAEKEFSNFYDIIDYIATYYILTMDFKSLTKLCEKEYCDKLVILTSDIIKRYFNDMEITYLAQRIKDGQEVNNLSKEKVIYVNKDQLESLDISNDAQKSIKKKRICIGIAKFYIKIAHIFAAIVMTVNPVYTYKDSNGQTVKTGLMEKDKIPKGVNRKVEKYNICDNRIRALKKGQEVTSGIKSNVTTSDTTTSEVITSEVTSPLTSEVITSEVTSPLTSEITSAMAAAGGGNEGGNDISDSITMQPKICDMNVNKDGTPKDLSNEPGFPELMTLYLDDNYDYSNGTFTGMSNETKKQFQNDLQTLYTAFTGNKDMPSDIKKFSDIKLRQYNNLKGCQDATPTLKSKYTVSKNDKLFKDYAENTQDMIQTAAKNQSKLLEVVNELFIYVIDPYNGKQKIRINPKLSEELLQKSVEKTRKLIIQLYIDCEMSYVKGIKLYEAIVESKILETTQKQISALTSQADKIIKETTAVIKPKAPIAKPIITSYKPGQAPLNEAQAPLNEAQAPLNEAQAPLNQAQAPLNEAKAQAPLNANIVPAITKPMNIQPISPSEDTNVYNENKETQINPQQNNLNPIQPV